MPTLLNICSLNAPEGVQGTSFVPVLENDTPTRDAVLYQFVRQSKGGRGQASQTGAGHPHEGLAQRPQAEEEQGWAGASGTKKEQTRDGNGKSASRGRLLYRFGGNFIR